jgi:hypothetical protein
MWGKKFHAALMKPGSTTEAKQMKTLFITIHVNVADGQTFRSTYEGARTKLNPKFVWKIKISQTGT